MEIKRNFNVGAIFFKGLASFRKHLFLGIALLWYVTGFGQVPSGYSVVIDQNPINVANQNAVSFTYTGAEFLSTYNYIFSSSGGGVNVTDTGTIIATDGQIEDIDLSGLADGVITLSFTLTNGFGTGLPEFSLSTKDATPPTIAIGAPSAALTDNGPIDFIVTYTGASAVNLSGKVTLNSTGTATGTIAVSGGGTSTRQVRINNITGDGTLSISIADGSATDAAGNTAEAAGPSTTFTVDNTGPTIVISGPSASSTNTGPVTYTITYSGASTVNLSDGDVNLIDTGSADGSITVSGTGTTTRTVTISGITGNGTLGISLDDDTARDVLGNRSLAAGPSATFIVDNTAPTISIGSPSVGTTNTGPVTYTVAYTGASSVTLAVGNITLNTTGTATGTLAVTGSGNAARTVTISSISGNGTLGISIAAGTASDSAGNLAPAAGPSTTFTVVPPCNAGTTAPTINGGVPTVFCDVITRNLSAYSTSIPPSSGITLNLEHGFESLEYG